MPYLQRHILLLLLIMIGFAVRVYLLNDVTLSPDERNVTNQFLHIPLADLLRATTQHGFPEHLFAGILIWSSHKLGWQLFLLRWPGIWFSVLTLAVIYKLTQKVVGSPSALAATFLLTLSYYHIYFSHQIRGYAEVVFFAALSFFFLWQAMKNGRSRDWLFYALTSAFGLYNQFYTFTLLATQGIIVAIWLVLRAWRRQSKPAVFFQKQVIPPLTAGVGSVLLAAMLFAPILPQFFRSFAAADSDFTTSSPSLADTLFPYYYLFYQYSGALSGWSALLYLSLILIGLIYLFRLKPDAAGILLGWLIIPLLMVVFGQLYVSWFYVRERYLIYLLPAFIMLAAAGWMGLLHILKKINFTLSLGYFGLSLILITTTSLVSIFNYLETATVGNWQAAADFLAKNALPTDMIVCEPFAHNWQADDLDPTDDCTRNITYRFSKQNEAIYPVYNLYTVATYNTFVENPILLQRNPRLWVVVWNLPASLDDQNLTPAASFNRLGHTLVLGPISGDNVIAAFAQALEQVRTLADNPLTQFALLVRLADLQAALGQIEAATTTLARARATMPDDQQAENQVEMIEQRLDQPSLIASPAHAQRVDLGGQILFRGYSLSPKPLGPGQPAKLTLFWQAVAPINLDYSVFLHLRDEANQTIAQLDFSPNRPTSSWWSGDVLQDTLDFELPAHLPAGKYRLLIGLYNLKTLERLPVIADKTGENAIELTHFVISN